MSGRVLCAMSGGVDSSAAAFLLREAGNEVIGVTMCLGVRAVGELESSCCGVHAIEDARRVCGQLGIPHYVFDYASELQHSVVDPFVREYEEGRTPNPCIECNRSLKFGSLLEKALGLGFDYIATGHYAQIAERSGTLLMKRAENNPKDQTYFLYAIEPWALKHILFPVGNYKKEEVRSIARKAGLSVAEKKESYDICFIPDRDLERFLLRMSHNKIKPGAVLYREGQVIGEHKGFQFYTVGQRSGLGIAAHEKLYVTAIDPVRNTLTLGKREDLLSQGLTARRINLFTPLPEEHLFARIRYSQREVPVRAWLEGDRLFVHFKEPQEAVTPGQSVVLYQENYVIGGGIIESVMRETKGNS